MWRPLTSNERETVLRLLPRDGFAGVNEYREQLEHAQVTAGCECGCPSIDFDVDRERARRSPTAGTPLLPFEAHSEQGGGMELILFAPDGWLQDLELVAYSSPPPAEFPPAGSWTITRSVG